MKFLLCFLLSLLAITSVVSDQENCIEKPESCAELSEYTEYISCIDKTRRQKRSAGCSGSHSESCEYVDCQVCQESCDVTCDDCECPNQCRQCCSETCTTNLCCHKTCHNQCKTNYCRTECKKECKQRISDVVYSGSTQDEKMDISLKENSRSNAKHNITTIINLHNVINNTNLIDIPIKINNTNYNNITLKRDDKNRIIDAQTGQVIREADTETETNEEKCCYVVGPRQCVKTNTYPFMKCFHHRHKRCAPYCVSTIVHAQPQHYCDETGCHNKLFYIPQTQPRCSYQPNWPFVSCSGQNSFHNCHGCYDLQPKSEHHQIRCSRCYDNGFNSGPLYRQGPFYQPNYMPGPSYPPQQFMGGYPAYGSYYPGYQSNMPPPYQYYQQPFPQAQQYQPPFPMYSNPEIAYAPDSIYDNEIIDDEENATGPLTKSGDSSNEVDTKLEYPQGKYVHETVINADQLNNLNSSILNDQSKETLKTNHTKVAKTPLSRYALISIAAPKQAQEKKEKRFKKKKQETTWSHEEQADATIEDTTTSSTTSSNGTTINNSSSEKKN